MPNFAGKVVRIPIRDLVWSGCRGQEHCSWSPMKWDRRQCQPSRWEMKARKNQQAVCHHPIGVKPMASDNWVWPTTKISINMGRTCRNPRRDTATSQQQQTSSSFDLNMKGETILVIHFLKKFNRKENYEPKCLRCSSALDLKGRAPLCCRSIDDWLT